MATKLFDDAPEVGPGLAGNLFEAAPVRENKLSLTGSLFESAKVVPQDNPLPDEPAGSDWLGIGEEVRGVGNSLARGGLNFFQTKNINAIRRMRDIPSEIAALEVEQKDAEDYLAGRAEHPGVAAGGSVSAADVADYRRAMERKLGDIGRRKALAAQEYQRLQAAMPGLLEELKGNQELIEALPQTEAQKEFHKPETPWWKFFSNPVELSMTTTAESAPVMAETMAAAPMGPGGMALVAGGSSFEAESGARVMAAMQAAGVDLKKPAAVMAWFAQRAKSDPALAKADLAALGPAAFDGLSGGIAGRWLRGATGQGTKRLVGALAKESGSQMAAGGAGSIAGSLLVGEPVDWKDVVLEIAGEFAPTEAISSVAAENGVGLNDLVESRRAQKAFDKVSGEAANERALLGTLPPATGRLTQNRGADLSFQKAALFEAAPAAAEVTKTGTDAGPAANAPAAQPTPAVQKIEHLQSQLEDLKAELTKNQIVPKEGSTESRLPAENSQLTIPAQGATTSAGVASVSPRIDAEERGLQTEANAPQAQLSAGNLSTGGNVVSPEGDEGGEGTTGVAAERAAEVAEAVSLGGTSNTERRTLNVEQEDTPARSDATVFDRLVRDFGPQEGWTTGEEGFYDKTLFPGSTLKSNESGVGSSVPAIVEAKRAMIAARERAAGDLVTRLEREANEGRGTRLPVDSAEARAALLPRLIEYLQKKYPGDTGLAEVLALRQFSNDAKRAEVKPDFQRQQAIVERIGRENPAETLLQGLRVVGAKAGAATKYASGANAAVQGDAGGIGRGEAVAAARGKGQGGKALGELARIFGVQFIFVERADGSAAGFHGYKHRGSNSILIDAHTDKPLLAVAGHELLHHIRLQHEGLFNELEELLLPLMRNVEEYRARLARLGYAKMTDGQVSEELLGDFVGDSLTDEKFLKDLARKEPTLFRKFVRVAIKWIDKILGKLRAGEANYGSSEFITDLTEARKILAETLKRVGVQTQIERQGETSNIEHRTSDVEQQENEPFSRKMEKRSDKEAQLSAVLTPEQMRRAKEYLTAGDGLNAARKRELQHAGPGQLSKPEFYALYDAHVTNLRDDSAALSKAQLESGMTGGWVVPTRPTSSWDFSRGNYRPGHQVVLVPQYWIVNPEGRPARIANGYKPRADEVAILKAGDFFPDGTVDFAKVFGVEQGQFSRKGDDFAFDAAETVAEQRAREKAETRKAESKNQLQERAARRLVGNSDERTGEMFDSPAGRETRTDKSGQGSLFSRKDADGMDLFAWGSANPQKPIETPKDLAETPELLTPELSPKPEETSRAGQVFDFGEKIGGARKDKAQKLGPREKREKAEAGGPAWARRYEVRPEKVRSYWGADKGETGKFTVFDKTKDRQHGTFETEAEAQRAIPLIEVARNHRVYRSRKGEEFGIYRQVGDYKRPLVKGGFATEEAAKRYMAEHPEEIIEHKFEFPDVPWLDSIRREGPEYRKGDVTPKMFQEAFGFRGGEFGNWNQGSEGQAALNYAYDALMDLARLVNVPPRALSLNGKLAIAFGARGTGGENAARAHYEPDYRVINLTKIKGAGSLAHEWLHSLDHYLGAFPKYGEGKEWGLASTMRQMPQALRPELREAFDRLVKSLSRSEETRAVSNDEQSQQVRNLEKYVREAIDQIRRNITLYADYRKKPTPTEAQMAEFDAMAERIATGDTGKQVWVNTGSNKPGRFASMSGRYSFERMQELNAIYKNLTGASFDRKDDTYGNALFARIQEMNRVKERMASGEGNTKTTQRRTQYFDDARDIDMQRASDYWSIPEEMLARAFAAYIYDKAGGENSQYLVHAADNRFYKVFQLKPYPEGQERTTINSNFDALFNALKVEGRDEGAPAGVGEGGFFSRKGGEVERLQEQIEDAEVALRNAIAQQMNPARGMTKQEARDIKNRAAATLRNLRADLLKHPEYVEQQVMREREVYRQLKALLEPTGVPVHPELMLGREEAIAEKLSPAELQRVTDLMMEWERVRGEIEQMPKRQVAATVAKLYPAPAAKGTKAELDVPSEWLQAQLGENSPVTEAEDALRAADKLRQAFGALPENAKDLVRESRRFAGHLKAKAQTFGNRDIVSATKDAADNKAQIIGKQSANVVLHELNRAFGVPLDTRNGQRENALTFAIEAGSAENLAAMRQTIEGSEFARSRWGKDALHAITYAEKYWERFEPVVGLYEKISAMQVAAENSAGIKTLTRQGGYVFHLQDVLENWAHLDVTGGAGGAASPFKQIRDYATYADSIANGLNPKSLNAVDLMQRRVSLGQKLINYRGWVESLKGLNDPATALPLAAEVVNRVRADGTQVETAPIGYQLMKFAGQTYAIHKGYAGLFKALTTDSNLRQTAGWHFLMKSATTAKHMMLLFDSFHLGRLAYWNSITRGAGQGLGALLPGNPFSHKRGVTLMEALPADIKKMGQDGELTPEQVKELLEQKVTLGKLLDAGLNVGNVGDNVYSDWVQKLPLAGQFNRWLFEKYQRGAMTEVALIEYQRQRRQAAGGLSDEQVARKVARAVNIRFGNLNAQAWVKSKFAQDLFRLVFLAPQWNESLLRAEMEAVKDAGKFAAGLPQGKLRLGTLGRAVATAFIGQFIANQFINWFFRGQPTWDNDEEGFEAKISAWVPDYVGGSSGYFLNPLTLPAEMTHLILKGHARTGRWDEALVQALKSRFSSLARFTDTFLAGKNSMGERATGLGSRVKLAAEESAPLPIGAQAPSRMIASAVTGENKERYPGQFQRQLMQSVGIKPDTAPSAERRIQGLAREFVKRKNPDGADLERMHSPYADLDNYLRVGNRSAAREELGRILETRTGEQIRKRYEERSTERNKAGEQRPVFTSSGKLEEEFKKGLTAEQKERYAEAVRERKRLRDEVVKLLRELSRPKLDTDSTD